MKTCCGYWLEVPRQGASNEYPKNMFLLRNKKNINTFGPALVAQLDACPTGDQEAAGWTPAEIGNILSWRLIVKYFLRPFSPFR